MIKKINRFDTYHVNRGTLHQPVTFVSNLATVKACELNGQNEIMNIRISENPSGFGFTNPESYSASQRPSNFLSLSQTRNNFI